MNAVLLIFYALAGEPAHAVPLLNHFLDTFHTTAASVERIARFDLDVDGDGSPEIFLGFPGNQYGQDWIVYKHVGDNECESLGVVRFHFRAFYYDLNDKRLWAYVRVTSNRGGWAQFRLTPSGFVEDQNPGKRNFEADRARADAWKHPPLGWAKASDIQAGAEVWRDLQSGTEVMSSVGLATLMVR